MKQIVITKEFLYDKAKEISVLWDAIDIVNEGVIPTLEMVAEKSHIVGKLTMLNELIDHINETTR